MYTLLPYSEDLPAQKEAEALQIELKERGGCEQLPPWGKIWSRNGKVVCVLPTHPIENFNFPPVVFIDESSEPQKKLFFIGSLVFRPLHALVAVSRHIQNLIVLAQAHAGFWLPDHPPPRLHLRELTNIKATNNTPWKYVPRQSIEMLFRTFVPSIRELAGLKLIAPIELSQLNAVLENVFPDQVELQLQQLSIQLGAIMLRGMLAGVDGSVKEMELVADHDHTPIRLGTRKKQATLHLLDGLTVAQSGAPMNAKLSWNKNARYSSKFPDSFTLDAMNGEGFPLRELINAVGLQFTDVYLGLWRILNSSRKPFMGISLKDLGNLSIVNMSWANNKQH